MPLPVVGKIVKLVGSGIGVARESYLENKEKKELAKSRSNSNLAETSSSLPTQQSLTEDVPPEYSHIETTPEHANQLIADGKAVPVEVDASSEDEDEEEWKLDEATDYIDPPSYGETEYRPEEEKQVDDPKKLTRNVMILAPPVSELKGPIPVPVVIPQRRPRAKGRGFVRAYSPVLDSAALNERCFLEFLKCFHLASEASKGLKVVFLAAGVVGFVPEVVAQIVSTVVQVGAGAAIEIQSRHRANTFLDEMNERLFKPRGLYAIVMSYKPDATKAISVGEFDPTATVARYDQSTGTWRDKTKQLRVASGTTYSDLEIGETAPLIFPVLEQAAADPNQSKWNSAKEFLGDYGDKRAQATYQKYHPESKLAAPAPVFRSRFSDPNHAVNNGNIVSLVSGGLIDPSKRREEKRERKRERRVDRRLDRGFPPPRETARDRRRNRGDEPKGFIRKALTEDVLYLMIVNMPSEKELAAVRMKLAHEKNNLPPMQASSSRPPPASMASNISQPDHFSQQGR
ncbi:hypothetical protein E2P81_ATG02667 [Venturia nashicola]|uniref:Uncharacterized protein n=1 Tax=Venturia nashicola TaxID=86259 RepID=A0A4Z1PPM6_9PEZI|nr:hypothetical protein E6O75_ATG02729 [Venturia nashicola]TLD36885.1 hypothetical protein E2P81_ATG02667 [Venturia nashicola]